MRSCGEGEPCTEKGGKGRTRQRYKTTESNLVRYGAFGGAIAQNFHLYSSSKLSTPAFFRWICSIASFSTFQVFSAYSGSTLTLSLKGWIENLVFLFISMQFSLVADKPARLQGNKAEVQDFIGVAQPGRPTL